MPKDTDKYKDTFLREATQHVAAMNASLLKLEKKPQRRELLNDIFRQVHTLKSMAATMNYVKTAELCHAVEDVLDGIRKKRVELGGCVDLLFECFDALQLALKLVKEGKREPDTGALAEKLHALSRQGKTADYADNADKFSREPGEQSVSSAPSAVEKIEAIQVKVETLDQLMNLAEELLINKMRLDRIKEDIQNPELTAAMDTLGRLVTDIQYNVMQSRMVPIGFVFNRFPRMVRDLARGQEKEINLEMEGSDIELDRGVIDEIGESLVHLIRNAVDHGIETPEARKKAGKPLQGTIRLTAKRAKGLAVIEVSDDGSGLDIEDIKNQALKRGVISPGAIEEEIMNSIFSGVSTTKQVTQVSGRGFGVNIVKERIESIGGSIKVTTAKSAEKSRERREKTSADSADISASSAVAGTTFSIEIPLTLAIIKALFVEVAAKPYAIPLVSVERLISVDKKDIKGMLNFEAVVLDEEDIPITRLDLLFDLPSQAPDKQPIAVVRRGKERLGLAVDAFLTTEEIVIKPLNRLVRENKYFAGTTIIGSGEVVLILDVANLVLSKRRQPQITQMGADREN